MKESPQEIGFVIGGIVGFIWLLWVGGKALPAPDAFEKEKAGV